MLRVLALLDAAAAAIGAGTDPQVWRHLQAGAHVVCASPSNATLCTAPCAECCYELGADACEACVSAECKSRCLAPVAAESVAGLAGEQCGVCAACCKPYLSRPQDCEHCVAAECGVAAAWISRILLVAVLPFAIRVLDWAAGAAAEAACDGVRGRLEYSPVAQHDGRDEGQLDHSEDARADRDRFATGDFVWVRDSDRQCWARGKVLSVEGRWSRCSENCCSKQWLGGPCSPFVSNYAPDPESRRAYHEKCNWDFIPEWRHPKPWAQCVKDLPNQSRHSDGEYAWVRDIANAGFGSDAAWQWCLIECYDAEGRPVATANLGTHSQCDEGFKQCSEPLEPKPWTRIDYRPTPGFPMQSVGAHDSSWELACQMNGYGPCWALAVGLARLLFWHLAQPAAYAYVFRSEWSKLDTWQQGFGSVVAAREALYCLTTLVCLVKQPAFLLVDVVASVRERNTTFASGGYIFAAVYITAPEKYVINVLLGWGGFDWERLRVLWNHVLGPLLDLCGAGALVSGLLSGRLPAALAIGYAMAMVGGAVGLSRKWYWSRVGAPYVKYIAQ